MFPCVSCAGDSALAGHSVSAINLYFSPQLKNLFLNNSTITIFGVKLFKQENKIMAVN